MSRTPLPNHSPSALEDSYLYSSLVPDQTPATIDPLVIKYLNDEFAKLKSKNKMSIESLHGGKPWVADTNHWNYQAAKVATKVRFSYN